MVNSLGFSSNVYSYSIIIEGIEYHLSIDLIEEIIYIVKINGVNDAEVICPIEFNRIIPNRKDVVLNMISNYIRRWYIVRNRDEIIDEFLNFSK